MLVLQNVCEINREHSRLTADSSVYDSTKHNGLATIEIATFITDSMYGQNPLVLNPLGAKFVLNLSLEDQFPCDHLPSTRKTNLKITLFCW